MKTTELIEFLKHNDVTEDQLYNMLIADLGLATQNASGSIADPMPQRLISFFMYEIQAVVFPVIRDLRTVLYQTKEAGQLFKDELDRRDLAGGN